ncbi:MAG: sensor histidine kinase [Nitrospirae bacterium]|nr:sensor histidine kinase [Nitrospirota bacterium]
MYLLDLLQEWAKNNLDIIFFIYGLGFLMMGITILVHPKKGSEFRIADSIWLLAAFGLTHGLNEHLDMWALIKGRHVFLDFVRWYILVISYIFLFEFGRNLMLMDSPGTSMWQKRAAKFFGWWNTPLIAAFIVFQGVFSSDFWMIASIWTRYLFGFTGSFMIGFGLFTYYKDNELILGPLHVKKYFFIFSMIFYIYGVLGGLVVPKSDFAPSSWLNTESFFEVVHIPVQFFRAICALTAAWAVGGMLQIFNWEIRTKLKVSRDRLRKMIFKISKLEEDERRRIAEDLHDHIGQNLAISKIRLKTLKAAPASSSETIDDVLALIDESIAYTRSLTFELSPPIIHQLGFVPAVEWLAEQFRKKYGLVTEVVSEGDVHDIGGEKSILLFKTVRELLHNIVKHARAGKVVIRIKKDDKGLCVIIEDDGIGFDAESINDYGKNDSGFGIFNIQERIAFFNGTFNIKSGISKGTKIEIILPLGHN